MRLGETGSSICSKTLLFSVAARTIVQADPSRVGLVVKTSTTGVEDPGFESRLRQDFSVSSHTSDLKPRLAL